MHLFEAAIAWIEATEDATDAHAAWVQLARELCELCLMRFIDSDTGVLREFFDESWRPMPDDSGRIVEPGHQFEWSWLLLQWARMRHCQDDQRRACRDAARKLAAIGERGVDPSRGVAINEMWDDLAPKDASAKLWPQTERVKAWCAMLSEAGSAAERGVAGDMLNRSVTGLLRYLDFHVAGLWHEVLLPDGRFAAQSTKASSFYHIVCAIETLDRCVAALEHSA